jgi:hypothetical protein
MKSLVESLVISRKKASNAKNKEDTYNRAFLDWLHGNSLRDLQKMYGIHRATLSYQFRKRFGKEYAQHKRVKGAARIIEEYLSDPKLTEKDKNEIRRWLVENREFVFMVDLDQKETQLYSDKEINCKTVFETSQTHNDYRDIFSWTKPYCEWRERFLA